MQPSNAEVRAGAVAKLKRATSLPRIKGGRRPPMHPDGASEGEKSREDTSTKPGDDSSKNVTSDEREEIGAPTQRQPPQVKQTDEQEDRNDVERIQDHSRIDDEGRAEQSGQVNGHQFPSPPSSPKRKRRSRSRSRSRSKDLKDLKPSKSPTPVDSSPEGKLDFLPAFDDIPVASPVPSRPTGNMIGRFPFIPPTAPSTPSLPSAVPTLQDLQQRLGAGLFRSQSASRTAAMLKLTGVTPNMDRAQLSPSPGFPLSRSNTVTGSEQRAAARQRMMGRIQNRVGQIEDTTTSGGEDVVTMLPKRRRRRSRRSSGGAPGPNASVVDDRELSTSTSTPLVPSSSLPPQLHPDSPSVPSYPIFQSWEALPRPLLPPAPASPPPEVENVSMVPEMRPIPVSLQQWTFKLGSPRRNRDDVVIEDPDDDGDPSAIESEAPVPLPLPSPTPPRTPPVKDGQNLPDLNGGGHARVPHTSDAPSAVTISSGHDVPVIMSADFLSSPYKQDVFPKSPFNTPLKERPRDEEEEEEIVYRDDVKARRVWSQKAVNGNGIDWPGRYTTEQPVIPVQDDEEEEEAVDAHTHTPGPPNDSSHHDPRNISPSPAGAFYPPASPSSVIALSHTTSNTRESAASSIGPSPALATFPNTTGIFHHRPESYTDVGTDYEDVHTDKEISSKRAADGTEKTGWAKWKGLVTRNGSLSGRRSRTNSASKREDKATDRESGASVVSGKVEHVKYPDHGPSSAAPSAWNSPNTQHIQLAQEHGRHQPMQSASASASILSLSPTPYRGGPSPIPPASPADLFKYSANNKLTPFPGLAKLDEERKKQRSRRMSASVSSPNLPRDVARAVAEVIPTEDTKDAEIRERKLSHQYSDSGLLQKFRSQNQGAENESFAPISSTQTVKPNTSGSPWLPMSRTDLRKWYKANKFFNSNGNGSQVSTSPISPSMISPPIPDGRFDWNTRTVTSAAIQQKLNDLLVHKPSTESATDFEEGISNNSTTPKSKPKTRLMEHDNVGLPNDPFASPQVVRSFEKHNDSLESLYKQDSETDGEVAPNNAELSHPTSSIIVEHVPSDRSWTVSHTDSSLSSVPSDNPIDPPERASVVLQRLDSFLSRNPQDRPWAFLDEPPRRLLMSSSFIQVFDSSTIRERFIFLFNDILVVAKPFGGEDKSNREFTVKSIVDLHNIHVMTNRDEGISSPARPAVVQQFIREFGLNSEKAVSNLLESSGLEDDQVALGKLLFNTYELDRTRRGGYLCKRSRKTVLKSYLDCFGFTGVRIDHALRAFCLSVRIPTDVPNYAQEYFLNTFASRWFEANARIVSFDKDVATKLVRIIVHYDSQIHKAQGHPDGQNVPHFHGEWEGMLKAIDPRHTLSDSLIEDIYNSLLCDPLRWAIDTQYGRIPHPIMFKRPPPNYLAQRVQSDPITLRIPHPDPQLRIQLLSQDGLIFDPPILSFARSTEVAFRVTGTSLGPKTIIFSLLGTRAPFYSGIPFSKTVVVERQFMRHTVQVAFKDQRGSNRRYMFSSENAVLCHQLVTYLRQAQSTALPRESSAYMRQVQKATKGVALNILREATSKKILADDLIELCKQNSLLPFVLPNVTNIPSPS